MGDEFCNSARVAEKPWKIVAMADDNGKTKMQSTPQASVPTQIPLSPGKSMDIAWLPEADRKALLTDYTKGMLDLGVKAQEMGIDATALKTTLDNLTDTTRQAADSGNAVTVSHTQTSSVGRTEVIMGNTQQAQNGKLSKSQTGEKDMTVFYVIGGIVALIVIVALMG